MELPTHDELIERIDAFLKRHSMGESRFGRDATGEPGLVDSIRKGRSPSLKTLERLKAFMERTDAAAQDGEEAAAA